MRCPPKTKAERLLCVLFLRVGSVPVGPTAHRTAKAMTPRRFPPPWSVEEQDACFVVTDSRGRVQDGFVTEPYFVVASE
jgi:hypothetical protein